LQAAQGALQCNAYAQLPLQAMNVRKQSRCSTSLMLIMVSHAHGPDPLLVCDAI